MKTPINGFCRVNGCGNAATTRVRRGKWTMQMCEKHATEKTVLKVAELEPATTGYKEFDRDIDQAVDVALLRVKPILRDFLREELKRHLEVE